MSIEKPKTSFIHFETQRANKARWVRQSQAEGMKLRDWVERELNRSCNEKPKA